jgi:hypothetical protein
VSTGPEVVLARGGQLWSGQRFVPHGEAAGGGNDGIRSGGGEGSVPSPESDAAMAVVSSRGVVEESSREVVRNVSVGWWWQTAGC